MLNWDMENKMETTIVYRGYIGMMEGEKWKLLQWAYNVGLRI